MRVIFQNNKFKQRLVNTNDTSVMALHSPSTTNYKPSEMNCAKQY